MRSTLARPRAGTRRLLAGGLASLTVAAPLRAQDALAASLPGYGGAAAAAQRAIERSIIAVPSADTARALSRVLSAETHVAGSPAGERVRDLVLQRMRALGLETDVRRYDVFLPFATGVRVWRTAPTERELPLAEPPVAGDPTSATSQYLTVNGYSAPGDVSGEVVFVNYGLIEDYARLDSIGVSVHGRIVVARYGRSFRGIKAREAERHGAAALLIYSDPQNDGYVMGDIYPDGPMRNWNGVQRGSVLNGAGDPATPGYPSVPAAPRLPADSMDLPRIPVVPISYANASELLEGLRGWDIPDAWQGGLPFRYHVGPGPVRARVQVADDRATRGTKPIYDVLGIVRGSELPDERVIVGGHRDAWSPGAADNVSGTVSVLEAARAVIAAARAGHPPKRTIVFASWDAEEWGLIGSTEYVEQDSTALLAGGVAYLNQDGSAQGPRFGAGGSPSLRALLRDVARTVRDPTGHGSVYTEWQRTASVTDTTSPPMTDPGGGSDFAGFYNHLGVPIADWGFGRSTGVYHSQYDDFAWMARFGDSSFTYHAATAAIGAAMALRLANAEVIPYDYVEFARTMRRYVAPIERRIAARGWSAPTQELCDAIDGMERAATSFASARDAALARGATRAQLHGANAALLEVERALTRPAGLRTRPWYRNLIYVADENNGYANMPFPSINEAIRAGDASLVASETTDLAAHFDDATAALTRARARLAAP
ncbi:MAG TPA: M20/M25/M40 family metallo-hydrolase [Gemmatimonadaceae bacterium]|nr:M20/M25/M40 family metallo-hydrolase [Gemmatimonadaceae bacterium]